MVLNGGAARGVAKEAQSSVCYRYRTKVADSSWSYIISNESDQVGTLMIEFIPRFLSWNKAYLEWSVNENRGRETAVDSSPVRNGSAPRV